jgi:hypothetical protein
MIFPPVTRRTLFGAATLLGPLLRPGLAMPSDPLMAAIRITEAADMAYRAAGLVSPSHLVARASHPNDRALSAEWRAHRDALARARSAARTSLHALTPTTQAGAHALVRYYANRVALAHPVNARGASRAAQRRLREVFARPGACLPALTHHPPLPG